MSSTLCDSVARVLVRISSDQPPEIRRHCPRCAVDRRFASSGKFRVNAQRKTIDAWLIFLCTRCGYRWNLPIHERQPVKSIDPAELEAMMRNDPVLADRLAAGAGNPGSEVAVSLVLAKPIRPDISAVELTVVAEQPNTLRLDRLLAMVLGLRREEIQTLAGASILSIAPPAGRALRRPARDGQKVRLDLSGCSGDLASRCRMHLASSSPAPGRPD